LKGGHRERLTPSLPTSGKAGRVRGVMKFGGLGVGFPAVFGLAFTKVAGCLELGGQNRFRFPSGLRRRRCPLLVDQFVVDAILHLFRILERGLSCLPAKRDEDEPARGSNLCPET